MDIFLIDSKGSRFHFPVNPEELNIRREKGYETVNILSLGEYDFPTGEKVKEIAFSSFFPIKYDSYCRYQNIPNPLVATNKFNTLVKNKEVVRLIISKTDINVLVIVSAHDTSFKGGEPGDIYFDLTFRTWRKPSIRLKGESQAVWIAGKSQGSDRPNTKQAPKTYIVKSGDSLSKIAKLELGNSSKWTALYALNKKTIGPDPSKLTPGQKLVMS